MAAYASSVDLIAFYDENTVKDLLSDTGTYSGTLSSDSKLTMLLEAGAGRIESACGVSNLYTPTELAALTGNSLGLLKQINCQLCMVSLIRRRPEKFGDDANQVILQEAEEFLDRLRKGERLFDDSAKREAGLPTIDGPSAVTMQQLNLLTTRTHNYFPGVAQRLPLGR
jgi:hypothetical protein